MMADIFVSYNHEDKTAAEGVVDALRRCGRTVWWDDRLTPHQAWDSTIEREIRDAKAVIVLWTPTSVSSDWVRSEAHFAQNAGKLVPVILRPCEIPLAFLLRQAIDLTDSPQPQRAREWPKLSSWLDAFDAKSHDRDQPPLNNDLGLRSPRPQLYTHLNVVASRYGAYSLMLLILMAFAAAIYTYFGRVSHKTRLTIGEFSANPMLTDASTSIREEIQTFIHQHSLIAPDFDKYRPDDVYFVDGRIEKTQNEIKLYSNFYIPTMKEPVAVANLRVDSTDLSKAVRSFSPSIAFVAQCIATGTVRTNSDVRPYDVEKAKLWADYCSKSVSYTSDNYSVAHSLERYLLFSPNDADAWAILAAEYEQSVLGKTGSERSAGRMKATRAMERALMIDPKNSIALEMLARKKLGVDGPDDGKTLLPNFANFPDFERLMAIAINSGDTFCACEIIDYAQILSILGRSNASLSLLERAAGSGASEPMIKYQVAYNLWLNGDYAAAESTLSSQINKWINWDEDFQSLRLRIAIDSENWELAQKLNSSRKLDTFSDVVNLLIDALKKKDSSQRKTALRRLKLLINDEMNITPEAVLLLAKAGDDQAALNVAMKLIEKNGADSIPILYQKSMYSARDLPEFKNFVTKTNLIGYWRLADRMPDFCKTEPRTAYCRSFVSLDSN